MIEEALRQAGIEREAGRMRGAVGLGPGFVYGHSGCHFDRAGGWQLAGGTTQLLGISSVDCLLETGLARSGMVGRLNIVIDAQRKEFYLAQFELAAAKTSVLPCFAPREPGRRAGSGCAPEEKNRGTGFVAFIFPKLSTYFRAPRSSDSLPCRARSFVPGEQLASDLFAGNQLRQSAPRPELFPDPDLPAGAARGIPRHPRASQKRHWPFCSQSQPLSRIGFKELPTDGK